MTLKICYLLFQNSNEAEAESEVGGNLYERISYGGRLYGTGGRQVHSLCLRIGLPGISGRIR